MDTPTIKLNYEYKNPNNIESEVPGGHELREALNENIDEGQSTLTEDNKVEIQNFTLSPVITVTKKEATFTKGDLKLQKVTVTEDISVSYQHLFKKETLPGKTVVTTVQKFDYNLGPRRALMKVKFKVTEATTGSEVSLQLRRTGKKLSKEDDIQNGGTHVRREIRRAISHNIISRTADDAQELRNGRTTDNTEDKTYGDRRTRTRIPKLRQTIEKLKERRHSKDTEKHEAPSLIPTPRRSSIPKLNKESKLYPPIVKKEVIITKEEVTTKPDDEFDKIYEEIVENKQTYGNIDDNILNTKIDDPDKLEIKFEEIMHDYEENEVPVQAEKVRPSRIPFLKRKSEHEIEIPKTYERTTKTISSSDQVKVKNAVSKLKEPSIKVSGESSIKKHIINNQRVTKTFTTKTVLGNNEEITSEVQTTPENSVESVEIVETTTEIPEDITDEVEYRVKDSVRIVTPDIRKHYSEMANMYKSNYDNEKVTITEIKDDTDTSIHIENQYNIEYDITEPNCEISSPAIEESNKTDDDTTTVHITEIKEIENDDSNAKVLVEERDSATEEDIPVLRGKVGRMISRIASIDSVKEDGAKKDFSDEIPKKRSVLSRIAMFERQEPNESTPKTRPIPRSETKTLKVFIDDIDSTSKANDKPKIVEEVLKSVVRQSDPFPDSDKDQNPIDESSLSLEEVRTLEEILEPLDKELEAIGDDDDQADEEASQRILSSNLDDDRDENNDIDRNESINTEQRKSDSNDYQNTVEIEIDSPFVVEECKVIGEVLKRTEVEDIAPKIDLTDNGINDSIPSTHTIEVVEISQTIDDVVTLPESSNEHGVLYERAESFSGIDNEPKAIGHKDVNSVTERHIIENRNKLQYERGMSKIDTELKGVEYKDRSSITELVATITNQFTVDARDLRRGFSIHDFEINSKQNKAQNNSAVRKLSRKENDDVFEANIWCTDEKLSKFKKRHENCDLKRAKSLAEVDLGDAVKGQVNRMIVSMKSVDKLLDIEKREVISIKERPTKRSVSEKIALFERKLTPVKMETAMRERKKSQIKQRTINNISEEEYTDKIAELNGAKIKYGKVAEMPTIELRNSIKMPVLAVGTALLDPRLTTHVIMAAIDLGYRGIDAGYVYGNEKEVGAAIKAKIDDGTVRREDLFIINKLWSTFHRQDLAETACRTSLDAMGLEYFDLYLIHNPMSFKEGSDPFPKIATVLQYSAHDFMDAWFGMEVLVSKGLVRSIGLSNFNSAQVLRVVEKGRIKPVVNQVECHPYLSQQRLDNFCSHFGVKLSCFGVLGSKGTPLEYKSGLPPVIDDALVQVMASGLGVTPAQLLIRYQIQCGHHIVVKSSSGARLWDNLQALNFSLTQAEMDALNALNRNKRTFTFKGMGDTHKNYPFSIAF